MCDRPLAKSLVEYHQLQAQQYRNTAETMWRQEHDVDLCRHSNREAAYHERIVGLLEAGKSAKEIDTLLNLRGRIENEERTYHCLFCDGYHGPGLCPLTLYR